MGPIGPPEPLAPRHDLSHFSSGVPVLDGWLWSKARLNETRGGAHTYVACDGDRVARFYSLAASSVERQRVSSRAGRNMPDPIPVILLGQIPVDEEYRGRRVGTDVLVDAGRRALAASRTIGARAIIVQAIDEGAAAFYARFDYRPFSEREPLMMILRSKRLNFAVCGRALLSERSVYV